MQLSKKSNPFCQIFNAFMKSTYTFEHFQKKDEAHSLSICEFIDSKSRAYLNVKKVIFQNIFQQPAR